VKKKTKGQRHPEGGHVVEGKGGGVLKVKKDGFAAQQKTTIAESAKKKR